MNGLLSVMQSLATTVLHLTDLGRAQASMRFRTAQPMATSVCCATNERARSHRPTIDL